LTLVEEGNSSNLEEEEVALICKVETIVVIGCSGKL
jgi:hypothetical protein